MATFISEVLDLTLLNKNDFNLIVSGCGTGKSYMVSQQLFKQHPEIRPEEVIFVTSRTVTVMQHAAEGGFVQFDHGDKKIINFWNGGSIDDVDVRGVRVMTYDKITWMVKYMTPYKWIPLVNVKALIFDECHTLFSDTFCRGIDVVMLCARNLMASGNTYVIGMTATGSIVDNTAVKYGYKINHLLPEPLFRYQAKRMICTDFKSIPLVLRDYGAKGKTMILCNSIKNCEALHNAIPNSAVIVSDNNKFFTDEMERIRSYIVKHSVLPDEVNDPVEFNKRGLPIKYQTHPLDVLIATTSMREGYNIDLASNVRNIVCCIPDSIHVVQFAGRARYDLDNIIVASPRRASRADDNDFMHKERALFDQFLDAKNDDWFGLVSHIVKDKNVTRVAYSSYVGSSKKSQPIADVDRFVSYINTYWLIPDGDTKHCDASKIITPDKKAEIIDEFCACNLHIRPRDKTTFRYVMQTMQSWLGYRLTDKTKRMHGKTVRTVYVVEYDPSSMMRPEVFIKTRAERVRR